MNAPSLSAALRDLARRIRSREDPLTGTCNEEDHDASTLLVVLAGIVEGKTVRRAFGAPGDWGYGTPIGEALRTGPDAPWDNMLRAAKSLLGEAALGEDRCWRIGPLSNDPDGRIACLRAAIDTIEKKGGQPA